MSRDREVDPRLIAHALEKREPRFELGQVCVTPGALTTVPLLEIHRALVRHQAGDWGEIEAEDRDTNEAALADGARILSSYRAASGAAFWIITEADRSATTVLRPKSTEERR